MAAPDPASPSTTGFPLTIPARDGVPLSATVFGPSPSATAAPGTVVIPSAMAVPQRFYARFAGWLAEETGARVLTFDYRGMGRSRQGRGVRSFASTTVREWARADAASVVDWATARDPAAPLHWVGHSLAGQMLGFLPNADAVTSALTVGAGSGYYGHHPTQRRIRRLLFGSVLPASARVFGYFPGQAVGIIGDLPKGVALEWARWCASPHYVVDDEGRPDRAGYRRFRAPILALSFEDDDLLSKDAVDDLHGWFHAARVTRRHLNPAALGLDPVGHFGFFRTRTLWPLALEAFRRATPLGEAA